MKILFGLALALLALTGCQSYSWRAKVPAEYREVFVPSFRNETTEAMAGTLLTRQVLREFQREGTFKLAGAESPVEVQGTVTAIVSKSNGKSSRSSYLVMKAGDVNMSAKISVIDHRHGKVLVDNRVYQGSASYADSSTMAAAYDLAIERAADEVARKLVDDLTLLNWEEAK